MWIASDIILFSAVAAMIWAYLCGKIPFLINIAIVAYCCAPYLRFGGISLNPGYVITLALGIMCVLDLWGRRMKITWSIWIFLGFVMLYIGINLIATFINGVFNTITITSIIGLLQVWGGAICLCLQARKVDNNNQVAQSLLASFLKIAVIQAAIGGLQLVSVRVGFALTSALYAPPGRDGVVRTMLDMGRFYRMFGTSYTPVITGCLLLFCFTALVVYILQTSPLKPHFYLAVVLGLAIALLTFSKTFIIGSWLILVLGITYLVYERGKIIFSADFRKRIASLAGCTVLGFVLCTVICFPTPLRGQVNYYFGSILSVPMSALASRYDFNEADIEHVQKTLKVSKTEAISEEEHISSSSATAAIIMEYPIIGVGPAPILGEFVGDSQFLNTLHDGGILAAILSVSFFGWLFISALIQKNMLRAMLLCATAMCCFAVPIITYNIFIPILAFCLCGNENEYVFPKKRSLVS